MTKGKFVRIINEIKKLHEYQEELYAIHRKYNYDAVIDFPTLEDTVVELLGEVMHCPKDNPETDISYFIYELEFGKDWEPGMIIDQYGNSIDHSTAEKLYDFLVEEYSN